MKDLRKKTFWTIFIIISLFGIIFTVLFNIQLYQREYVGILNSITRMRSVFMKDEDRKPKNLTPSENDFQNHVIMDYEVYTFLLDSENNIIEAISHSDVLLDQTTLEFAKKILKEQYTSQIKIGNLYISSYVYHFSNQKFLTIVHIENTKQRLLKGLLLSLLILLLGEIVIYLISKKITDWITKPVEDSFQSQKEFIENASHELKTPLAVMIASTDCLEVTKKNEKWIERIKNESERMNQLITRLLDLSQSEQYFTPQNFQQNNLSLIIEKRALTFESLAFEKGITIETNIDEKILFLCNKESIDELVSILIDNAICHSFKNSKILINLSKTKSEIILEVLNQGEAIEKGCEEKIFERFYRGDSSHHRQENRYGLGLAIAKNIVIGHHGTIKAYSKNGWTTFQVVFKIKDFHLLQ